MKEVELTTNVEETIIEVEAKTNVEEIITEVQLKTNVKETIIEIEMVFREVVAHENFLDLTMLQQLVDSLKQKLKRVGVLFLFHAKNL